MAASEMFWRKDRRPLSGVNFLGEILVYGGGTGVELLDEENLLPSGENLQQEVDHDFDEAVLESWFWYAVTSLSGSLK